MIPIKTKIQTLVAYSTHADQRMLVDWVRAMPEPPKEIGLVHGEADVRRALALGWGFLFPALEKLFRDASEKAEQ